MKSILLEIPEYITQHLKLPPKRAEQFLMEELVLRLYEQGIISSFHGASLLNMDRISFEYTLAKNKIPMHCTPEEVEQDLKNMEMIKCL